MINKRIFLSLVVGATFLSSCQKTDLEYKPFDDVISMSNYTKKVGTAQGTTTYYVVYGKLPNGLKEGQAMGAFTGKFKYRIKELLDKYPDLRTDLAKKAQERQEKDLTKVFMN